jgi:hypothetical protein
VARTRLRFLASLSTSRRRSLLSARTGVAAVSVAAAAARTDVIAAGVTAGVASGVTVSGVTAAAVTDDAAVTAVGVTAAAAAVLLPMKMPLLHKQPGTKHEHSSCSEPQL